MEMRGPRGQIEEASGDRTRPAAAGILSRVGQHAGASARLEIFSILLRKQQYGTALFSWGSVEAIVLSYFSIHP